MAALRQLRMRRASKLLAANVLSIERIAHAVGYASRSSFSRAFRHAFGNDPAEYRALAVPSAVNDAGSDADQRDDRLILSGPIG
jgi:AraC family transcriptional activator of mtrCDE